MSHFVAYVIVPNVGNLEEQVEALLAPYDENKRVAPYETACYCKGNEARLAAMKVTNERYPIEAMREELKVKMTDEIDRIEELRMKEDDSTLEEFRRLNKLVDRAWKEMLAPKAQFEADAAKIHPFADQPNPECEECAGSGKVVSQYNPKSKWDWWVIGGRWSGYLPGKTSSREREDESLEVNSMHMKDLPEVLDEGSVPFAIVTPDGEWHERGRMGWFAVVHNENDDWDEQAVQILEKYRGTDHVLVVCDLHM